MSHSETLVNTCSLGRRNEVCGKPFFAKVRILVQYGSGLFRRFDFNLRKFLKMWARSNLRHLVALREFFTFLNFLKCHKHGHLFLFWTMLWSLALDFQLQKMSSQQMFDIWIKSWFPYMWSLISRVFAGSSELESASWASRLSEAAGLIGGHESGLTCWRPFLSATI